jgi:hypothetical protein
MSIKTRLEALEKRLAKPGPEETVVRIQPIIVRSRDEVVALDELERIKPAPPSRPRPRGQVRIEILPDIEAKDVLAKARAASTQDEGQEGSAEGKS